jgi:lipoprotein-anchoring transpeptidase ErfK/SrfK
MFSPLVRYWGGWFIIAAIGLIELMEFNSSIVAAPTYQDTLNQRMVILKKSNKRWIEVNLLTQRLIAWEGSKPVYAVIISTGKKSTPTIPGVFNIQSKRRIDRMKGEDYDIDDVPYVQYYSGGYAIHGAYWHKNFGRTVSHGCINLAVDHAKWLFDWSEIKTPLVIH